MQGEVAAAVEEVVEVVEVAEVGKVVEEEGDAVGGIAPVRVEGKQESVVKQG